jgi:hypothetical protein
MDFLKTVAGKVVSGVVALAVVALGITWWTMDPATKDKLLTNTGRIVGWFGVVLFLPWALFFVVTWVRKFESNLAGGALVFLMTALEVTLLLWLFEWKIEGAAQWTFIALGGLVAGVYNLLTCDWIAEKLDG